MSEHPSHDELAALRTGGLVPEREREVLCHLLTPCEQCLAVVPPPLSVLFGFEPSRREPTAEEEAVYDAAFRRAVRTALEEERHLRRERAQASKILKLLKSGSQEAVEKILATSGALARMTAFLDHSWQLRHEDPQQMVEFAWLAKVAAENLDAKRYGPKRVLDFQARAYAELGNAYRVANRPLEAAEPLGRARELFERGTKDKVLEIRLLELEASLAADCRQFGRASEKLLKVLKFYSRHSEYHLAGRTLILMGVYAGNACEYERAIHLLQSGLRLIDGDQDPSLACAAAHNIVFFLVDSDRFEEARKFRLVYSRHLTTPHGRINAIKFRLLDGRIDAGLGRYIRAEAIFREVKTAFEEAGLPILAGIEALDLAAVLLRQGKTEEATATGLEAADIFIRHQIQREALQAIILLRDSFQEHTATVEKVEEVARFLRRLEVDPALRFEGRAWSGRRRSRGGLINDQLLLPRQGLKSLARGRLL